ncbi:MAG: acyl--CoA ligase [Myxococcota bacterium]|jgi:acyl-CoA synthetase (AMP-forming)/AMP-acid ligase II|nr:acyl--CoA ligase [Myxococcota bacterium]
MTPFALLGLDADIPAPLLITRKGEWSRRRVLEEAAAFAQELSIHAGLGARLAISLDAGPQFVVSLVGAWLAGMSPVLIDPLVRGELATIVRTIEARVAVMPCPNAETDTGGAIVLEPSGAVAALPEVRAWEETQPAVYLCTSGSTGQPAIVPKTLASLLAEAGTLSELFDRPRRSASIVPYCHIYGFLHALLVPTFSGGTSVLSAGISPRALLELASRGDIDVAVTVPAVLKAMSRTLEEGVVDRPVRGTRFVTAGAALGSDTRARFEALSGCTIVDIYGSTEAGTIATRTDDGPWHPVRGVELRITSSGFLEVRSPSVALPGPDGFLNVGDIARLEGTGFTLQGRGDDIVKIGSRRTSLSEIEAVLSTHPCVAMSAVIATTLRGETRLVAFVQTVRGSMDEAELKHFVRERLADHKVPRLILPIDKMPVRAGGKPDRQALAQLMPKEPSHL